MKKVYVLYRATGEAGDDGNPYEEVVYGVFTSKKKVEDAKKQIIIADKPYEHDNYYSINNYECDYYEMELDKIIKP